MAVVSLGWERRGGLVSPGGPRGKGGPPSDGSGQRAQIVRWREWRRTGPPSTWVLLDEALDPTFFGWLRGHLPPRTLITSSPPFQEILGTHGAGQPAGAVTRNESAVAPVVRSLPRPAAPMATPAVSATRTHAATSIKAIRRRGLRVMTGSCWGSGRRAAVGWRMGRDIESAGGGGRSGRDEHAVAAALERVAQSRRLGGGAALEDLEALEQPDRLDPPELGVRLVEEEGVGGGEQQLAFTRVKRALPVELRPERGVRAASRVQLVRVHVGSFASMRRQRGRAVQSSGAPSRSPWTGTGRARIAVRVGVMSGSFGAVGSCGEGKVPARGPAAQTA